MIGIQNMSLKAVLDRKRSKWKGMNSPGLGHWVRRAIQGLSRVSCSLPGPQQAWSVEAVHFTGATRVLTRHFDSLKVIKIF
jgi:hypothetical protein